MTGQPYLAIGYLIADVVPDGYQLGGTASYAAGVAAAFGHSVRILTSAAADADLIAPLLPIAEVSLQVSTQTTTFENIYTHAGRVQKVYHRAEALSLLRLPVGWFTSPLVHLAPMLDEVPAEITQAFPDATVMLTPQGYMRAVDDDGQVQFKRWLDNDILRVVDILVLSEEDIAPSPELGEQFARRVPHCIITRGVEGGTYYHYGEASTYSASPVEEIHPTGAGDTFAAALLASLPLLDGNVQQALYVAKEVAALSVSRKGATDIHSNDIQPILAAARERG